VAFWFGLFLRLYHLTQKAALTVAGQWRIYTAFPIIP
jgi:hypothetical protein